MNLNVNVKKVKLAKLVEGAPNVHFSIDINPFPRLIHFTLDLHVIVLSVKQGGIKYHLLRLWYDSTWD